jgi:cytoskeletal protein RodZ
MRFGEDLRTERERRGISLDDVSVSTRVSLRHLHALEMDNFAELPGGVFNRGIVRSYAKFCGLDEERTLQNFTEALRASGAEKQVREDDLAEFAEAVRRSRGVTVKQRNWRWLGVAGMLLAVLLLTAGVLWVLQRRGVVHLPWLQRMPSHQTMFHLPERFRKL